MHVTGLPHGTIAKVIQRGTGRTPPCVKTQQQRANKRGPSLRNRQRWLTAGAKKLTPDALLLGCVQSR
jgi:hypothetical protein